MFFIIFSCSLLARSSLCLTLSISHCDCQFFPTIDFMYVYFMLDLRVYLYVISPIFGTFVEILEIEIKIKKMYYLMEVHMPRKH